MSLSMGSRLGHHHTTLIPAGAGGSRSRDLMLRRQTRQVPRLRLRPHGVELRNGVRGSTNTTTEIQPYTHAACTVCIPMHCQNRCIAKIETVSC